MDFRGLDLKLEYRSRSDDVAKNFLNPVLKRSVLYRRAVGFFSSTSFDLIDAGICGLIENGGAIQIVMSPKLSTEDVSAIRSGFKRRGEISCDDLLRRLKSSHSMSRLNLLSNLIAAERLDFKIAIPDAPNDGGMFHEKLGIMSDAEGNVIAFSGSMNESANAFANNYEVIDIFKSWTHDADRVAAKIAAFDALWNNIESGIEVLDFLDVSEKFFPCELEIEPVTDEKISALESECTSPKNFPSMPANVRLRDYQLEAIAQWSKKNYRGIFDMATGTGKTFTALAAVCKLFEDKKNLAALIVCPYQHLVEQWRADISAFGMRSIVCYSASDQKNWRERLKTATESFNSGTKTFFCALFTNATFSTDFVQLLMKKLSGRILLVVDEAHNFGARNLSKTLLEHIPYRLALSATIDRHGDAEGTQKLYDYFGEKCVEYSLGDAINSGMLVPYRYYPVIVSLTADEREIYSELTAKIRKGVHRDKHGNINFTDQAKMLLLKRARLVAGASEKISTLRQIIADFKDDNQILVYCGATTLRDADYREGIPSSEEVRQIDVVVKMLGNELDMRVSKFTSEEDSVERERIKKSFAEGRHLQALVAIRCLDEGVNIPSIRTAFILASSTNPKEYVQRRGRVLRTFHGKTHAIIYDFVTLPFALDEADETNVADWKSLAKRELARVKAFAADASNPFESDSLAMEIQTRFNLDDDEEGEDYV